MIIEQTVWPFKINAAPPISTSTDKSAHLIIVELIERPVYPSLTGKHVTVTLKIYILTNVLDPVAMHSYTRKWKQIG